MEYPYRILSDYAKEQNIRLGETWYEEFIQDDLVAKSDEEYVVKVLVKAMNS